MDVSHLSTKLRFLKTAHRDRSGQREQKVRHHLREERPAWGTVREPAIHCLTQAPSSRPLRRSSRTDDPPVTLSTSWYWCVRIFIHAFSPTFIWSYMSAVSETRARRPSGQQPLVRRRRKDGPSAMMSLQGRGIDLHHSWDQPPHRTRESRTRVSYPTAAATTLQRSPVESYCTRRARKS